MSDPKSAGHPDEKSLKGTVKAVNFAPKGEVDGFLLEVDGQIIQINVPPDRAEAVVGLVGRGVEVKVGPEPKVADHPKGDHPAHKLVAFAGEDDTHEHPKPHDPKPKPKPKHDHDHGHGEPVEVTGKVQRLNYAKHGEANGVVLDTGDFVHLKPDGMKKVALQVGHEVRARGKSVPTRSGGKAVEAEVVNTVAIGHGK